MKSVLIVLFIMIHACSFAQNKKILLNIKGLPKQIQIVYPQTFPDSTSAVKAIKKELNQLQFLGYFNADVANLNWKNDSLIVDINLGELSNGFYLQNGNIPMELINELGLKEQFLKRRPLTLQNLNNVYKNLLSYYENNGYPFAVVWLDSLQTIQKEITVKVYVKPNQNIIIDTLRLVGDVKINQGFLTSYLGIKKNQNYNESKVLAINKRLKDLPFVNIAKSQEVVFSANKAKINIFLQKQNANQFDGIIGFLPNATTGKIQLTGDFKLNLINALKNGETFNFNYRGLPSQSQELTLKLAYPYIFKSQIGLDFDFQLFKRDTSFLNLNSKIAFAYNFNSSQKISFFLENFTGNQVANQTTNTSQFPSFANIKSTFYGLAAASTKLDDRITPLKGWDLMLRTSVGNRKVNPTKNFKPEDLIESPVNLQYKIQADLKYYLKLDVKSVLYFHNLSGFISGNNLFENEGFRIGGFKTLRGFDEQSINISSFSVQTAEFRYMIEKNSYLNVFYDQAFTKQSFINIKGVDNPFGFGLGITFQTKVGIASLNYALGKQKNNPLDLQNGKIHFGIISYF
jgi:outer membrane translocation and assembly module TamA